jgi:O-antigen chain-terminating methyltransferase
VIEHLPFPALARLVAAAFRALRPGGVVILETPNPENLIVGACNFYYDPTHVRPLPPEPVRFLLESNGFERVAIERLHPGAQPDDVERATDPVGKLYASIMLVPQDYAVIGYKPAEALA